MIEPDEPYSERITIRARPSDLRRLEAAAGVAGVTRSRILREGARRLSRKILEEAVEAEGEDRR